MASVQVQQPILAFNCVKVGSVFIEECQCARNFQQTLRRSLLCDWTSKNVQLHPEANRKCQGTLLCCRIILLIMSGHFLWWLKHKVLKRWWQCFYITNQCLRSNCLEQSVRSQYEGWMTSELMKNQLTVVWNMSPGLLLRRGVMLVLDAFKGLLTPEIKPAFTVSSMDTDLVVIHGGISSQLQIVNKPFRDHLKQLYSGWHLIDTMLWPQLEESWSPLWFLFVSGSSWHGSASLQKRLWRVLKVLYIHCSGWDCWWCLLEWQ